MSILLFFVVLAVLILSHELGHFMVAKYFGIRVDEFGFGFPPKLFSKRKGETEYSFNLIPFGGFVKIFGEDETEEFAKLPEQDKARSLLRKPKKIQAAVIVAGVLFNFILAWMLFSTSFTLGTKASVSSLPERLELNNPVLTITHVLPESPAALAGLKGGDEIVYLASIDTTLQADVLTVKNMQDLITSNEGRQIFIGYSRDGAPANTATIIPEMGIVDSRGAIGVSLDMVGELKLPFYKSIYEALIFTFRFLGAMIFGLIDYIYGFFVGSSAIADVSGPVGMVNIVGEAGKRGLVELLNMTALISLNLAVINMIPFPALDGGRLLFLLVESVKGRPINKKTTATLNAIGFVLLIFFMFAVTYSDVAKIFIG